MPDFRNDRMTGFVNKERVQTKQGKKKKEKHCVRLSRCALSVYTVKRLCDEVIAWGKRRCALSLYAVK